MKEALRKREAGAAHGLFAAALRGGTKRKREGDSDEDEATEQDPLFPRPPPSQAPTGYK